MKKQEKTKEILNILYDLRALVTTNTNQDAIISYLNNLISQYENTNQTLHTHQTINTYKQLCYEVMTSFDREKHPEENRIFYVAYQRLKRAKNEKEAIYILEQALDIYSHDHPLQPNFRYIRPDKMKQYLKQHRAWLNYDPHGKQAMFFYCDLSLKHLQEADLDKAIFHHCLFHQSIFHRFIDETYFLHPAFFKYKRDEAVSIPLFSHSFYFILPCRQLLISLYKRQTVIRSICLKSDRSWIPAGLASPHDSQSV